MATSSMIGSGERADSSGAMGIAECGFGIAMMGEAYMMRSCPRVDMHVAVPRAPRRVFSGSDCPTFAGMYAS